MMGNTQLCFDFVKPLAISSRQRKRPPTGSASLYFAVLPPPATASVAFDLAHRLRGKHRILAQPHGSHLLHVSVCNIGAFDQLPKDIVSAATGAASSVRMAPFVLRFDRALSFASPQHPLVLCGRDGREEINSLQAQLGRLLRDAGLRIGVKRDFEPHMTLFYNAPPIMETLLEEPIAWTVEEFVLIHSVVGQGRHEHVGVWPLRDPGRPTEADVCPRLSLPR